jgi:hypothetical protein
MRGEADAAQGRMGRAALAQQLWACGPTYPCFRTTRWLDGGIEQAKKSPVVKPGFKRILETGVSRGSKETTRALNTVCVSQRMGELSGYSLKAA